MLSFLLFWCLCLGLELPSLAHPYQFCIGNTDYTADCYSDPVPIPRVSVSLSLPTGDFYKEYCSLYDQYIQDHMVLASDDLMHSWPLARCNVYQHLSSNQTQVFVWSGRLPLFY